MRVGIVILTYNNEGFAADAIKSLKDQQFTGWKAVIVDNSSTDHTLQEITAAVGDDQRFEVYVKPNEGPAAARNFGSEKLDSSCEYIHFLDGDDALLPSYLSVMVGYLDAHPGVGLVACQFLEINAKGKLLRKGHRSRSAPRWFGWPMDLPAHQHNTPFVTFFCATGQGPFGTYRRSVFTQTGGFDLDLAFHHEDTDMFCKMCLLAEVHYLPHYLYKKRKHQQNLSTNPKSINTYLPFRNKWDYLMPVDTHQQKLISEALQYYYTRHKPLRDFKVGVRSILKYFSNHETSHLHFAWSCFKEGIEDLIYHKRYKMVLRERQLLANEQRY